MVEENSPPGMSLWERLGLALKLLFNGDFARDVRAGLDLLAVRKAAPKELPPERVHASGLFLLGALQREGRLIDFLKQDVAAFSDEEVGAAARVVHQGCRQVLDQYVRLQPARAEAEGTSLSVPKGFDPQRTRLTGNVAGQPPFRGTLKHHGWVADQIRLPSLSEDLDPRVIAPAEIELT